MSLNSQVEIVRINNENYPEFTKLLEWRRTGKEQENSLGYQNEEQKKFFEKYNILNSNMFFVFGAKVDDKFVGYINAVLIPKPDPRLGVLFVDELWTVPTYRKKGIAKRLMNEVLELGKELNLCEVRLYVSEDNPPARNLYKKVGFSENDECLFCQIPIIKIK